LALALAEDGDVAAEERRVRNDDGRPVARLHQGVAPTNLLYLALPTVLELDPVADVNRSVELERDSAQDVAKRRLERDGEHAADDGRSRDYRAYVVTCFVDDRNRHHDVGEPYDEIGHDLCDRKPGNAQE